jgi:hypothetical protein
MTDQDIGWWRFNSDASAMHHLVTGQSVRLVGGAPPEPTVPFTNSQNRIWLRFDYQDRETTYPLLVEWRNVPGHGRPLTWRVDHERSARLWRLVRNADAEYPPYGLWRRVDDCIINAFSCWPSAPTTGRYPTGLALNAGWLNGKWTTSFYRATWSFGPARMPAALDADAPILLPIDAPAPLPWVFSAAQAIDEASLPDPRSWQDEPEGIAAHVHEFARAVPHLMTEDGSRLLLGLPRAVINDPAAEQRPPIYRARLLYTDRDVVTDGLMADIGKTSGPNPLKWTIARTAGLVIGLRGGQGEIIRHIRTRQVVSKDLEFNREQPPNWLSLRLAHATIDARLGHPNLGVDFTPRSPEAASTMRDDEPTTLVVSIPYHGTGEKQLYAGTSLRTPQEGAQNHLTPRFFDEENDGILRATSPVQMTGFWTYDPETRSLINIATDRRLQFVPKPDGNSRTPGHRGVFVTPTLISSIPCLFGLKCDRRRRAIHIHGPSITTLRGPSGKIGRPINCPRLTGCGAGWIPACWMHSSAGPKSSPPVRRPTASRRTPAGPTAPGPAISGEPSIVEDTSVSIRLMISTRSLTSNGSMQPRRRGGSSMLQKCAPRLMLPGSRRHPSVNTSWPVTFLSPDFNHPCRIS